MFVRAIEVRGSVGALAQTPNIEAQLYVSAPGKSDHGKEAKKDTAWRISGVTLTTASLPRVALEKTKKAGFILFIFLFLFFFFFFLLVIRVGQCAVIIYLID